VSDGPDVQEMTVEQIINGDPEKNFPGLLPIVQVFHEVYKKLFSLFTILQLQ
jgi:hypothetical protein